MRVSILLFGLFCFIPTELTGQIFQGQQNLLIPPNSSSGATEGVTISEATVTGVGVLSTCNVLERVLINITHSWTGDVGIFLISPSGTVLELTTDNGGSANNWLNTEFRDDAPLNITTGTAPYTGQFRPEGRQQSLVEPFPNISPLETFTLANTFTGENADGVWQLYVNDHVGGDIGEILNWELEFAAGTSTLDASLNVSNLTPCSGDPVDLDIVGTIPPGVTFNWSTGANTQSITVAPTGPTLYRVTITDGACEQELQQLLDPPVAPVISGPATACNGETVRLTTSGPGPFTWSTGQTGTFIDVSPATTTVYTVSNGPGSCSVSPDFTVTISPPLSVSAGPDETICSGDPVILTATGDGPFAWSDGQSGASIVVSPASTITYTVTVGSGTCPVTDEVVITVNQQPTLDLGGDQTYCVGEATSLTAIGAFSNISWNNGATTATIPLQTVGTQTYTATASNGTCTVTESVTITINPAPTVTAGPDQQSCAGDPVVLTATGDGPFNWSDGQTGSSITVFPTTTTTYLVDVASGSCSEFDQVTVTVEQQPTLDLGGDQTYCVGEATSLTANGAFNNISWNNGATTATIPLQTVGTQTYTATASNGTCTVTESVTITINPAPTVMAGPDQQSCAGDPVVLTATGDGPFTWSDGQTGPSITVFPTTTTTYFVDVASGGCSEFDQVTVTVEQQPTLDLGGDQIYCIGEANSLTATGNFNDISWNTGATGATIPLHASGTQSYTATVSNGNCTLNETVSITINEIPTVSVSPDQQSCAGDPVVLTATGDGPFTWSDGQSGPSITVAPTTTTTYFVDVANGNCTNFAAVTVTVNAPPTLDLGGDRTFCQGEATTLTAVGNFTNIVWASGATTSSVDLHNAGTQTYTATVDNGSCSLTQSVDITIIAAASVAVSPDQTICAGDSIDLVATGTGPFTWNTGQVSPAIRVSPATTTNYTVQVGGANCGAMAEVQVSVAASPTVSLGEDQTYCAGEAGSLTATGNFNSILWSDGQGQPTIDLHSVGTRLYVATVTTGTCTRTDSVAITVLPETTVSAGQDQAICQGDQLELAASGTGPFVWNTGEAGATISVLTSVDTSFIVTAGVGNCLVTDTVRITVNPLPLVDLGPDRSVCSGTSTTLFNRVLATNYAWSNGFTGDSLRLEPLMDSEYALSITELGCSAADTVQVTVRAPGLDLGPDQTVCPGDSVRLRAPMAEAYQWSDGFTGQTLRLAPVTDQEVTLAATIDDCPALDTVRIRVSNNLSLDLGSPLAICPGDSVVIRPQNTDLLAWSTGESASEITVSPTSTTRYFATAGTGNCAVTDSVDVTVLPPASVALGADQTVCLGDEVLLVPTGDGSAFSWSNGEVTPELTLQPDTSTVVSVRATNAAGCDATDSIQLRVVRPVVTLGSVPDVCPGDSLTLIAGGGESYQWSGGETSANIQVQPFLTTTYRVTAFTENCPATDSVTVTVRPRARVTLEEDLQICVGETITLSASGDGPFRWSDGTVGDEIVVQPSVGTTYFAIAGNGNCADTAFQTVDFFPAVQTDLGADQAICFGDSVQLMADVGTATLRWADGDFGLARRVSPVVTTNYRIVAEANGCVVEDSVVVTVNPLPMLSLLTTTCAPDNLTYAAEFSVSGGSSPYFLNGDLSGGTTLLEGLLSGESFTAVVTDANGCQDALITQVDCGCTEIILGAAARGCNGSLESRELSELLPAGTPQGTWSVLNPDGNGLPLITGSQLSLLNATAGTYILQYTPAGAALECLADYRTTITISDPPTAGQQSQIEERCVTAGGTITLFNELTDADQGGTWVALSANTLMNPAVDLANGRFATDGQPAGDYRFRYVTPDDAGCSGSAAEVVIRLVAIEVAGAAQPPACNDACSGTVLVSDPEAAWLYALNEGTLSSANRFGGLCPGTYTLRAEDERGCTSSTQLEIPAVPAPEISLRGNLNLMFGDSTRLEIVANTPVDNVRWSPAVNCLSPDCLTAYVRPLETTIYQVTFTSLFGCTTELDATVIVDERTGVYVPNAFSPNADGVNDLLQVYAGDAIASVENFRLFDRWGGQLVNYEIVPLNDADFGWNGSTTDGRPLPPAVYVYQLTFTRIDGRKEILTGEVTLMR